MIRGFRIGLGLAILVPALCMGGLGCSADATPADGDQDVEAEASSEDALAAAKNDLTAKQAKDLLLMINDHCSDAWCETDYHFDFRKIVCDFTASSCTFTAKVDFERKSYWRSCKMRNVGKKYSAIVQTFPNGFQDITDAFFDKLGTCTVRVEKSIP
jgi:hypothetical protein